MLGQRNAKNQSNRRKMETANSLAGVHLTIVSAAFDTPAIAILFNQPIVLRGIPQYLTNTNKLPTAASLSTDKRTLTLTYDTPGSVTSFTVPDGEPAVSAFSGPGVPPGTFLAT